MLDDATVQEIAEWQHCDSVRVAPGRWDYYNWHGEKVAGVYAMPLYEEPKR